MSKKNSNDDVLCQGTPAMYWSTGWPICLNSTGGGTESQNGSFGFRSTPFKVLTIGSMTLHSCSIGIGITGGAVILFFVDDQKCEVNVCLMNFSDSGVVGLNVRLNQSEDGTLFIGMPLDSEMALMVSLADSVASFSSLLLLNVMFFHFNESTTTLLLPMSLNPTIWEGDVIFWLNFGYKYKNNFKVATTSSAQ
ncbi:hypothetical protein WICPIJ_004749 [Wickerhamomyces pijperi]|uniref:Uncharacterized protein n=1 Tax=Wickerhamomyces pijperi TaxID=599730 RepID=A0A9P8TMK9_WICPI|nr:hypothetical protein WICPIJ_004749 [Wickerhamomyces pijperi]